MHETFFPADPAVSVFGFSAARGLSRPRHIVSVVEDVVFSMWVFFFNTCSREEALFM